jgi:signal transduction histidine kinase
MSFARLKLNDRLSHWARKRFAFAVLLMLAGTLLVISEKTYHDTTATLDFGIALTDARIESMRLLQLTNDAEIAQFGFLVTGQDQYLAQFDAARAELPAVQQAITVFFADKGARSAADVARLIDLSRLEFENMGQTLALARAGQAQAAADLARSATERKEMVALRAALKTHFLDAAALQANARVSIYDALMLERVAVGSLTLLSLFSMFLFLRQLALQDRSVRSQQAALHAERERLEEQVRRRTAQLTELAQHLQSVREDERALLALELHDELGGLLTVSKLEIARARSKVNEPEELLRRLDRITDTLNQGIALKRRIIEDLRPSALTHLGLAVALQNLCSDMGDSLGIPVRLTMVDSRLSRDAELAVYRFVQEALTNVGKYASATEVEVRLEVASGKATVTVRDDGSGFDTTNPRAGHHGLAGMQFRAESLGGSMHIESAPGKGTVVRIEFAEEPDSQFPADANSAT